MIHTRPVCGVGVSGRATTLCRGFRQSRLSVKPYGLLFTYHVVGCIRSYLQKDTNYGYFRHFVTSTTSIPQTIRRMDGKQTQPTKRQRTGQVSGNASTLPNSIQITKSEIGYVHINVVTEEQQHEQNQQATTPQHGNDALTVDDDDKDKQFSGGHATRPDVDEKIGKKMDDGIAVVPETVLQYERQRRKVLANQRSLQPLNIQDHLRIVYQDEYLVVADKPSGVLCVPGLYNKPNLLHLVCQYCGIPYGDGDDHDDEKNNNNIDVDEETKNENKEPKRNNKYSKEKNKNDASNWIVHRLDMDTSGLVLFVKNHNEQNTHVLRRLQKAFRDREVYKEYQALLCGHVPLHIEDHVNNETIANTTTTDTATAAKTVMTVKETSKGTKAPSHHKGASHDHHGYHHIHLPLQRDHRHPPFMRIATPCSELSAGQAVSDLQTHGFSKLIKKRPKPSHTEFAILRHDYLDIGQNVSSPPPTSSELANTTSSEVHCQAESAIVETGRKIGESTAGIAEEGEGQRRVPVTRVALIPHTGRTHQLRVHCAAMGYPIVGDPAYGLYGEANPKGGIDDIILSTKQDEDANGGGNSNDGEQEKIRSPRWGVSFDVQDTLAKLRPPEINKMCLHATKLSLKHPVTGETMTWIAPPPF